MTSETGGRIVIENDFVARWPGLSRVLRFRERDPLATRVGKNLPSYLAAFTAWGLVRQRYSEPRDRERSEEDPAFERVHLRTPHMPQDQSGDHRDKRQLDVQRAAFPLVKVRCQRDSRGDQHRYRNERAPTEAASDATHALAVDVSAKRRYDRGDQEKLPADEERHRQQVEITDERHSSSASTRTNRASAALSCRARLSCIRLRLKSSADSRPAERFAGLGSASGTAWGTAPQSRR